jgi:uncharacterized protein (DUF1778 family)
MKIRFPRNEHLEKKLHETLFYKQVEDFKVIVGYQGFFEIQADRRELELSRREFARFYREIRVEGGSKRKTGNIMVIAPVRKETIHVRLQPRYRNLLNEVAEKLGVRSSDYARLAILTRVREILEALGGSKGKRRSRRRLGLYRSNEPVEGKPLTIRLSSDEKSVITELTRDQETSEFIRAVLESVLLKDGRELGLLAPIIKKPQTSEGAPRGG